MAVSVVTFYFCPCFFLLDKTSIAENHQTAPLLTEQERETALVILFSLWPFFFLSFCHLAVVHISVLGEVLQNMVCMIFSLSDLSFMAVVQVVNQGWEAMPSLSFSIWHVRSFYWALCGALNERHIIIIIMTLVAKLTFLICVLYVDKVFPSCILQHESIWCNNCILCVCVCLITDLSGTRGGTIGGVLDPASEGRGGLGGGCILSDMS